MYSAVRNHGLASLRQVLRGYQDELQQLFLQLLARNEVIAATYRMRWQEFWAFLNNYKLAPMLLTRLEADRMFKLALQEQANARDAYLTFEDFLYALTLVADHSFKNDAADAEVERIDKTREDKKREYRLRLLLFWIDGSGDFFPDNVKHLHQFQLETAEHDNPVCGFAYRRLPKRAVHALRLCFEKFSRWGLRSNVGPAAKMHMWQFHSFIQHTGLSDLLPAPLNGDIMFIQVVGKSRTSNFAQFLEIIERVFGLSSISILESPLGLDARNQQIFSQVELSSDVAGAMAWLKIILEHVCPMLQESGELSQADVGVIRDQLERYLHVFTRPEQTSAEQEVEQPRNEVSLTDHTTHFELSQPWSEPGKQPKARRRRRGRSTTQSGFDWSVESTDRQLGKKSPRHQSATTLGSGSFLLDGDFPVPAASTKLEAARNLLERVRMRKASEASMGVAAQDLSSKPAMTELMERFITADSTATDTDKQRLSRAPTDDLSLSSVEEVDSDASVVSGAKDTPQTRPRAGGVTQLANDASTGALQSATGASHHDKHLNRQPDSAIAEGESQNQHVQPALAERAATEGGLRRATSAMMSRERTNKTVMKTASSPDLQRALSPGLASFLQPHAYSINTYTPASQAVDDEGTVTDCDTEASTVTNEQWGRSRRFCRGPTTWERMLVRRNQQTLVVDPAMFLRPPETLLNVAPSLLHTEPRSRRSQSAPAHARQNASLTQLTSNALRAATQPNPIEYPRPAPSSNGSSPTSAGQSVGSRGKTLSYDEAICDVPRQVGQIRNTNTTEVQCYFPGEQLEGSPTLEQLSQMSVQSVQITVGLRQTFDPTFLADGQGSVRVALYVKTADGECYATELDEGMWLGIRSRCKLRIQFSEVHGFLQSLLVESTKGTQLVEKLDQEEHHQDASSCVVVMALDNDNTTSVLSILAIQEGQTPESVLSLRLVRSHFACD